MISARKKTPLCWLWLSLFIVVIDQLSKYWVLTTLSFEIPKTLCPGLNLTLTYNVGAAFSLFSWGDGWQRWLFMLIAIIVSLILIIWLVRLSKQQVRLASGLALILGGAVGNLIDRIYYGYVIDFIDFHIGQWHWYTFNIADTAITIGAGLLILDIILNKKVDSLEDKTSV